MAETTSAASPDLTATRCGTCFRVCDIAHSDEGYSHCCNDRIEYPGEYLDDPEFRHEILGEALPADYYDYS